MTNSKYENGCPLYQQSMIMIMDDYSKVTSIVVKCNGNYKYGKQLSTPNKP